MITPDPQSDPLVSDPPASQDQQQRANNKQPNPWLQLLRLPNLFTVPGDPIAGFLVAWAGTGINPFHIPWPPLGPLLCAALVSLLLYAGGLLLNDYCDRFEDMRDRPHRPIPSGRVRPVTVLVVAILLLTGGVLLARLASGSAWVPASMLVVCIVAYDVGGKRVPLLGPLLMGACRGLSVFTGMLFAVKWDHLLAPMLDFPALGWPRPMEWVFPISILLYIAVITALAKAETRSRSIGVTRYLPPVIAVAWAGGLAFSMAQVSIQWHRKFRGWTDWLPTWRPVFFFAIALSTLAFTLALFRIIRSTRLLAGRPEPKTVQKAVGGWILSLIPLQACVIALAAPAGTIIAAVLLLAFYPLSLYTARRFYAS